MSEPEQDNASEVIHTPGPALPPELSHELLTEFGWTLGAESASVIRWY
jgi:hypothetical protein